jgi:polysaccharide biosynthesis protein VpsQ
MVVSFFTQIKLKEGNYVILKRMLFICLTIFYMALIWFQSSHFNPENLAELSSMISMPIIVFLGLGLELAHLIQFGLLYLCIIIVFISFGTMKTWHEITAATIALGYGVLDEIHQLYVPFRSFSFGDLLKDTIGVLVFWWVVHKSYFNKKTSKIGNWLRSIG